MTKTCRGCGAAKQLSEFPPDRRVKDGHAARCRRCRRRAEKARRDGQPKTAPPAAAEADGAAPVVKALAEQEARIAATHPEVAETHAGILGQLRSLARMPYEDWDGVSRTVWDRGMTTLAKELARLDDIQRERGEIEDVGREVVRNTLGIGGWSNPDDAEMAG